MRKFFLGGALLFIFFCSCTSAVEKHRKDLLRVAEEINEKCPKMLDSETRLDGIDVKEPNTLVYRFTLVHLLSKNVDTTEFYKALWPGIISNVKVSAEMKKLRDANTSIEYVYQDKENKSIYTFRIGPADYK